MILQSEVDSIQKALSPEEFSEFEDLLGEACDAYGMSDCSTCKEAVRLYLSDRGIVHVDMLKKG